MADIYNILDRHHMLTDQVKEWVRQQLIHTPGDLTGAFIGLKDLINTVLYTQKPNIATPSLQIPILSDSE